MRKYLLVKHEITCIQRMRQCVQASERDCAGIYIHTQCKCSCEGSMSERKNAAIFRVRNGDQQRRWAMKIMQNYCIFSSSSSSSLLWLFSVSFYIHACACNCVLKKCMVDLFDSRLALLIVAWLLRSPTVTNNVFNSSNCVLHRQLVLCCTHTLFNIVFALCISLFDVLNSFI